MRDPLPQILGLLLVPVLAVVLAAAWLVGLVLPRRRLPPWRASRGG